MKSNYVVLITLFSFSSALFAMEGRYGTREIQLQKLGSDIRKVGAAIRENEKDLENLQRDLNEAIKTRNYKAIASLNKSIEMKVTALSNLEEEKHKILSTLKVPEESEKAQREEQEGISLLAISEVPSSEKKIKVPGGEEKDGKIWINLDEDEALTLGTFKENIDNAAKEGRPYALAAVTIISPDEIIYNFYDAGLLNKSLFNDDFTKKSSEDPLTKQHIDNISYYAIDGINKEASFIGSWYNLQFPEENAKFIKAFLKATTLPLGKDEQIRAQHNLASYYARGKGTQQNIKLALQHYKQVAANSKDKDAGLVLGAIGFLYFKSRDYKEAVEYWLKGADLGDIGSQINLGNIYTEGKEGIPKDYEKAALYYQMAADQGEPDGKRGLAKLAPFLKKGR